MAFKSMAKAVRTLTEFQAWHENLKRYPLLEADAKVMLVDVFSKRVIPPSKFSRFQELYFGRRTESSLFEFHECCTNVLRETNLQLLPKRNKALNDILDGYIDRFEEAKQVSPLGDFYENRATSASTLPRP